MILKKKKKYPDAPPIGLFYNYYGTEYKFEVKKMVKPLEQLTILYSNGKSMFDSYVILEDLNHDNILDYILISDKVNNTSLSIKKNYDGVMVYDSITEENARKLLVIYNAIYNDFKKQNSIDGLIMAYQPKLEVTQLKIEQ